VDCEGLVTFGSGEFADHCRPLLLAQMEASSRKESRKSIFDKRLCTVVARRLSSELEMAGAAARRWENPAGMSGTAGLPAIIVPTTVAPENKKSVT